MNGVWPTAAQELMLTACLAAETEATAAFHRIAADWDSEHIDAGCAQLLPLLYRRWSARQDRIVLSGKKAYVTIWRQNQERLRRLGELLDGFREQKIACVLLKGVAMILRYYADPGLRSMRDFDLLVRPDDVQRAARHLHGLGYAAEQRLTAASIPGRMRTGHAWQFSHPDGQSCDLHWRPVVRCFAPEVTRLFWDGAEPAALSSPEFVLSPTDQLFHVCVHALQWDWVPQIRWIADAVTILREPIEWERMLHLANAAWMRVRLKYALDYLRSRFEAPVPATLLQRLETSAPDWERHEYKLLLKPCPLGFRDTLAWHRHHFRRIREFDPAWRSTPTWRGLPQYVKEFLNAEDVPESLRKLWSEAKARFGREAGSG
jgi:hypothetical protein